MKMLFKKILGIAGGNGLSFRIMRFINKKRLIILYYHRVIKKEDRKNIYYKGLCINVDSFDQQMRFLKKFYNFVSENDIVSAIENKKKLPDHAVWVTFDDGYKDNYTNAYPILKKYNIPATIFITMGYIDKKVAPWKDYIAKGIRMTTLERIKYPVGKCEHEFSLLTDEEKSIAINKLWEIVGSDILNLDNNMQNLTSILRIKIEDIKDLFMTWEDVVKLKDTGIFIGSHTVTHRALSSLSDEEIAKEISDSKKEITQRIGSNVVSLAYPFGKRQHYSIERCVPILEENNFKLAATTIGGFNSVILPMHPFNLKRIGFNYDDSLNLFKAKLGFGGFWQK